MTSSAAPPWAGPLSVPMPDTTAECRSEIVLAATRAAKADAFMPCSAWRTKSFSIRRASSAVGSLPNSM